MDTPDKKPEGALRKKLLVVAMLLTIPATVFAYSDYEIGADSHSWVGSSNYFWSSYIYSMAVGEYNTLSSTNSLAVGSGLLTENNDSLVVGKYNKLSSTAVLTVANGYYDWGVVSQNALEVHENGDVIISKKQGDIYMGAYGVDGD